MTFNSTIFIFAFLPLLLSIYYFVNTKIKNILLVIMSLIFYAWGDPKYCVLMVVLVLFDYIFARMIEEKRDKSQIILIVAILVNVGLLFYFKYTNFFLMNISYVFNLNMNIPVIDMPIGISFFVFQSLSYIIDVYRKEVKAQKRPYNVILYMFLFPQVIQGPIIRYKSIENSILDRKIEVREVIYGLERFVLGLFKKVVIANQVGALADTVFAFKDMTSVMVLLGGIAYTLQIYFDFSGYSDMAIGLGRMLGFCFQENFNYPYISKSITEFWRRWHISLSSWFRDYIYIPLGGNRKGARRTIINLLVVWLATGFWHGANWNFILWGLFYFILLLIEKNILKDKLQKMPTFFQHLYVLLFVFIGWILFRSESLSECIYLLTKLFDFNMQTNSITYFFGLLSKYGIYVIIGIIFSTPLYLKIKNLIVDSKNIFINTGLYLLTIGFIYYISLLYLINSTYNPFIYQQF